MNTTVSAIAVFMLFTSLTANAQSGMEINKHIERTAERLQRIMLNA